MAVKKKTETEEVVKKEKAVAEETKAADIPMPDGFEGAEESQVKEAETPETDKDEKKPTAKKASAKTKEKKASEKDAEKAAEKDDKAEEKESVKEAGKEEKKPRRKRSKTDEYLREKKTAIPKGLSEEDLLDQMMARNTFSGERATRAERDAMDISQKVITRYGDEKIETIDDIRRREYMELRGAAQSTRIIKGTIIGVHYASPENKASTIMADVLYGEGTYKVVIPSYALFNYDEALYQGEDKKQDLFNRVKRCITAEIEFIPAYVDEKAGVCLANRLRASSMTGVDWYLKGRGSDGAPRVFPGCLVKGRVLSVNRNEIVVDALGADISISLPELSYLHVGDARTEFEVNQDVVIKVLRVEEKTVEHHNEKYTLVKAEGSIKQATKDRRQEFIKQFEPGTFAMAEITYIDENLHVFCKLNGGQMDCLCNYPRSGAAPAVGQKRMVRIEVKDEESLKLLGRFVNA